jgi:NADPH2:quinone reductase
VREIAAGGVCFRQRRNRRRRFDRGANGKGGRRESRDDGRLGREVKQAQSLGADLAINYKTEDVAAKIKAFTEGAGLHVWYETLREPDYDRTVEAMRARGRIVIMAGRQARPPFPHGPFYVKCLSLFGFAMFNYPPEEQRRCADDINRWLVEGKLKPNIGKRMKLSDAAAAHQLQEDNTLKGAGTLAGKIVLSVA